MQKFKEQFPNFAKFFDFSEFNDVQRKCYK